MNVTIPEMDFSDVSKEIEQQLDDEEYEESLIKARQEFLDKVIPIVKKIGKKYKLDPYFLCVETGVVGMFMGEWGYTDLISCFSECMLLAEQFYNDSQNNS